MYRVSAAANSARREMVLSSTPARTRAQFCLARTLPLNFSVGIIEEYRRRVEVAGRSIITPSR
jgi:hypothetical protein